MQNTSVGIALVSRYLSHASTSNTPCVLKFWGGVLSRMRIVCNGYRTRKYNQIESVSVEISTAGVSTAISQTPFVKRQQYFEARRDITSSKQRWRQQWQQRQQRQQRKQRQRPQPPQDSKTTKVTENNTAGNNTTRQSQLLVSEPCLACMSQ